MSEFWRLHQGGGDVRRLATRICFDVPNHQHTRESSVSQNDKYLVQLRRELVRAQARLKRAESECDRLRLENQRLKELVKASAKNLDRQS
jgi:hypothetical protein